jgi:arylsulfatase A-like enzyme
VGESDDHSEPSLLARIGEGSALGWVSAAVCAIPTAFRTAPHGAAFADGWLVGAAVWTAMLVPIALIAPRAARGWRGVVGQEPSPSVAVGVAMWAGLSAIVLVALAAVLHAKTHHRGLGGATFGVFGAISVIGSAIAASRLVAAGRTLKARGAASTTLAIAPIAIVVAALGMIAFPLARSASEGAPLRALIWDLLLGVAIASLALVRGVAPAMRRPARLFALPLAAFTVIAGGLRIESLGVAPAVAKGGGVPGTLIGALLAWSDRDGDGASAHFGGRDCDEGDPRRYPGATDAIGDGLDSDCDGRDAPLAHRETGPTTPARATASPTVSAAAPALPTRKPDIVLVTLDTVRADLTSVYGFSKDTTPHIAKLAARGLVFEHAYAVGAETQRALVPLVSGRTLSETPHTQHEWPAIDERVDTVAERMSRAGYATAAVTTFTWLRRDRGFAQGFDRFDESPFRENHPERKVTSTKAIDVAIAQYEQLSKGDKPLFLWVHLFDAHASYLAHDGIDFGKDERGRYTGEIAFVDRQLGRLIDAVERGARGSSTAWLIHGSHGEAFGEHGSEGHGTQLFDEVARVPLVVVTPGAKPQRVETAVSVLDVAPTLLDLSGAPKDGIAGQSLAPALQGPGFQRAPFFAHAYRRVAVIDWPLKLISFRHKSGKLTLSLFDLKADPGEKKDLVDERSEDAKRLDALRKQVDD